MGADRPEKLGGRVMARPVRAINKLRGVNMMTKKLLMMSAAFSLLLFHVHNSVAEIYEYVDTQGVIHFTDEQSKVPQNQRAKESSLSNKDRNLLEFIMKLDKQSDVPVEDLKQFKKGLDEYRELLKSDGDDPEQLSHPRDSRLASPEGAINLYKTSLLSGNLDNLKAAVTSKFWTGSGDRTGSRTGSGDSIFYSGSCHRRKALLN
jgi:hypothetical protein